MFRQGGTRIPPHRAERYARFWDRFAWLKTPVEDMLRLTVLTADLARDNDWAYYAHMKPGDLTGTAALHFPARQIEDLTEIVHYSRIVDR
jgi:hypothetical protein